MATCATRINILTAVHMDDTLGQSENRSSAIELLLNCSIGSALSRDPMLLLIRAKCRFHLAPNVNEQLHIDTNQVSIVNFSLTWRNVITAVTTSPHLLNKTQWIDYSLNTADYDHDTVQVWWLLFFFDWFRGKVTGIWPHQAYYFLFQAWNIDLMGRKGVRPPLQSIKPTEL